MQLMEWLADWRRTGVDRQAQRSYVMKELARIAEAGAPVITQVLLAPLEDQTVLAMSVLSKEFKYAIGGKPHRYYLRLVPGVTLAPPFHRDPQGREVPADKRGKVLVAKVGTKGGQITDSHTMPESVVGEFNGPNVQRAATIGRDIYEYVEIGRHPVEVSREHAVMILRRYGKGIVPMQYTNRAEKDGPKVDWWIVEEVPPSMIAPDGSYRGDDKSNPKRAA